MRFLFFILLLIPASGFGQKSVTGCYSSNFAVVGWFVMHLKLNSDQTFEYRFCGDLVNDKSSGTYEVKGRFIYLKFREEPTTREVIFKDSLGNETKTNMSLRRNGSGARPAKLKYSQRRLFIYDKEGIRNNYKKNQFDREKKYFLKRHKEHGKID